MFIFIELFRLVGEQIGFEVLVFGPAGPDIEPDRCTFLSISQDSNPVESPEFFRFISSVDFKHRTSYNTSFILN